MSEPLPGGQALRVSDDVDVVVVGAGPVGLTTAILLAQRGWSVVVLERWPEPYPLPRAVHFDHEVGRILQSCGIGEELAQVSEPAGIYEWQNAAGATLLRFGRVGASRSGWPESSMFSQPDLEAILDARARSLPTLDIRRGVEVDGIVQEDDRVVVRDTAGGAVRAQFALGCDGANSTVRGLVDVDTVDLGFFYDWLIVDVILDHHRVFDPLNLQVCDPARPTTAVSGGPGRRRWEFMRLPHESIDDLNDESRAWELLAPWDVHPGNSRLERHAVYTFQARYAQQWRAGRVVLAGDAAHQMPPFAGQGLCAGIRDAANLSWKLDLVLGGVADPSLLDSYEAERQPSAVQAIQFSIELGKVICVPDPAEAALRDAAMAAAVTDEVSEGPESPGISGGLTEPDAPYAGRLLGQCTVAGRRFDDVYGAGWRLLIRTDLDEDGGADAIDPDLATWFGEIGGVIVVLDPEDAASDPWLAAIDASHLLQRPDFHLYGAAHGASGAGDLLAHLRSRLTVGSKAQT